MIVYRLGWVILAINVLILGWRHDWHAILAVVAAVCVGIGFGLRFARQEMRL